jgi:hypothetical protein
LATDAFDLGEHPGYEACNPVRVGTVACERFRLDLFGKVVGMMSVGAEVLCRIARASGRRDRGGLVSH